ncbi:hypothetical protein Tco_0663921, partial [Tanacetum coccineum]
GNKGIARLISHLKRLHLSTDERKCVLHEALSTDHGLYMAVEETLKVFSQWLCRKCMTLHAVSRACHHPDGLVRFSKGSDDMSGYNVGILKRSNMKFKTELIEGLVLDAELLDRVFKVPITTIKCIPHGFRLAFSQALKIVLYKVVFQPDSIDAWSSILKSLATWGKDYGITTLVKSMLDGSGSVSLGEGGGDFLEERTTGNTNIRQRLRKVTDGNFTAAVKVLSSSGVAPYCGDTIKALEAKHPYKPPPSMPSNTFFEPPIIVEINSVFGCIKSFPRGTSCRRDSLRAQHILDALCGKGSATATDLLKAITSVINLWLAGRCPPILAELVAYAPRMPLLKLGNGIRPIVVGTIWRRLVSKVAIKGVGKKCQSTLVIFNLESEGREALRLFYIVPIGNEIVYRRHTYLICHWGAARCPVRTLLFALVLHLLVHKIRDSYNLLLHACYLDDGTIIRDSKEVARVLDIINLSEGIFPVDIRRPSLGVKLLGGAVSRDADFISGMAMRRAANAVDLMNLLLQLHDPQSELLLLRSCLRGSIKNIVVYRGPFFGDLQWRLASLPIHLGGLVLYSTKEASFYAFVASRAQSWVLQDHILRDNGLYSMYDDYVFALACLCGTIPSFDFSCFTNKDTAPSKPQQTLASAFFSEVVKYIEVHLDMTVRQKVFFECLRASHTQDFLLAIPIDRLSQHMSSVEYHTILKYRLMIPLFPVDAICPVCHKACLDSFEKYAVHCKELPGFKY